MTKEKQIIAIAELDGFEHRSDLVESDDPFCVYRRHNETNGTYFCDLNYLTSRDAIIPVIEKHTDKWMAFCSALQSIMEPSVYGSSAMDYILVPAEQLAEALLRATGKWEE